MYHKRAGNKFVVNNYFIKCSICGTKFRVRWQIGYTRSDLIFVCPECGAKITGDLNPEYPGSFLASLQNAEKYQVSGGYSSVDYVLEASTEFFCRKLHKPNEGDDYISPFLRNAPLAFDPTKQQRAIKYASFSDQIAKYKNEVQTVLDLFNKKSYKWLKKRLTDEKNPYIQACKESVRYYRLENNLDLLMATHQYVLSILRNVMISKTNDDIDFVLHEIGALMPKHHEVSLLFLAHLASNDVFNSMNFKFGKVCDDFLKCFKNLLPLYIQGGVGGADLAKDGLTTLDVDALASLYKECFEFIGEYAVLVAGLNNLDARNDFNSFPKSNKALFDRINSQTKYNRIDQLNPKDKFSFLFAGSLNNVVRNSEAHFDTTINPLTQLITFTSKQRNEKKTNQMYLAEFGNEVIEIFQKVILLWEVGYQLNKYYFVLVLNERLHYGIPPSKLE